LRGGDFPGRRQRLSRLAIRKSRRMLLTRYVGPIPGSPFSVARLATRSLRRPIGHGRPSTSRCARSIGSSLSLGQGRAEPPPDCLRLLRPVNGDSLPFALPTSERANLWVVTSEIASVQAARSKGQFALATQRRQARRGQRQARGRSQRSRRRIPTCGSFWSSSASAEYQNVNGIGSTAAVTFASSCLLLRGVGAGDPHRFSCNRSCGGGVGAVPCTSDQPVS